MTAISMNSEISGFNPEMQKRNYGMFSQLIYAVTVYGEDNEYFTCEVMADSCAEASAVAESLASDQMINISHMQVMVMG